MRGTRYLHKELKLSFYANIHPCLYLNDNEVNDNYNEQMKDRREFENIGLDRIQIKDI